LLKRNIIIFALVLVVVTGMLIATRSRRSGAPGIDLANFKGKPAPDFTLTDIYGKEVKLSDYRGKTVLLNFWATWCPPCKAEMPWFVDLQKRYGDQGFQVIGVSMDDGGPEDVAKFTRAIGVNYPILMGKEDVAQQYGSVEFLPTTFFIDRQGKIVERIYGIKERREIEAEVLNALRSGDAKVPPKATGQ
jgi:cytochrome c biogenesis protein CcmG/thiol:disulfide interchange protein DsbE